MGEFVAGLGILYESSAGPNISTMSEVSLRFRFRVCQMLSFPDALPAHHISVRRLRCVAE